MRNSIFRSLPALYLILDLNFIIIDATDAHLEASMTSREEAVGRYIFDVWPDNPDAQTNGASNLLSSFKTVIKTGKPHTMGVQRYDIPFDGKFITKYWQIQNYPVLDSAGRVNFIINRPQDITASYAGLEQLTELRDNLRDFKSI